MIYLSLTGGLGNQLFQYAYAKYLSEKTNQDICIDLYSLNKDELRDLELNNFNIKFKIDKSGKARKYNHEYNNLLEYYMKFNKKIFKEKAKERYFKGNVIVDLGLNYKEFDVNEKKDIYLYGFFMSDKFFKGIENILKEGYYISPNSKYESLLTEISNNPNSVCVHYRKGDYKLKKNEHYQVCNTEYFCNAIEYLNEKLENPTFYVFSDSIDEVKEEFKSLKYKNIKFIDNVTNMIDEFALMMHCNNFVISNSTFSWWAQYLSRNEKKIVIAPKKWDRVLDVRDIYQDDWILM